MLLTVSLAAVVGYLNGDFGVPYLLVLMIGLAAALGWVMQRTSFGRRVPTPWVAASRPAAVPGSRWAQ